RAEPGVARHLPRASARVLRPRGRDAERAALLDGRPPHHRSRRRAARADGREVASGEPSLGPPQRRWHAGDEPPRYGTIATRTTMDLRFVIIDTDEPTLWV